MIAVLLLALALAQGADTAPPPRLPALHSGPIVLRGSNRAPLPPEIAARRRVAFVLGEARGPDDVALAPNDWIADSPAVAERLMLADAFEFGDDSPWRMLEALLPKKSESRAIQVVRERFRLGAAVIGTGRGAGFVSSLTLGRAAERERKERNPRRTDEIVSLWSLGFLPWALVATDEELGGDLEPFYAALIERHVRIAFLLEPEATLTVDLERGEAYVSGRGGVWLFDLQRARRDRTGFTDARLSRLQDGDAWTVRSREARLAAGAEFAPERGPAEPIAVQRALLHECLGGALSRLCESPLSRSARVVGSDAALEISIEADTRVVGRAEGVIAADRLHFDLRLEGGHTRP
jgi:hypothetical protein